MTLWAAGAAAGPQGGTVRGGAATITSPSPGRVEINQSSDRVIIDWQGFSIGAGETTRFNQPSSSSAALNRVVGQDPSQILGQLSANGRVLLINPNGVLFGAGSQVDVAGLVATTANISNDDFMARRLTFGMPGQPGAAVVNRGKITVAEGGVVALVAPGVANDGVITARLGRVSLVSADRFTVDFHGDRLIQFALDDKVAQRAVAADGTALAAAVSNSGRIAADGGVVQLSANAARGVLDQAIGMSGVIEARAVRQVGGRIVLEGGDGTVQVAGRLDASGQRTGQTGGTITITGERVGLFAGATVNASGAAGGGTVLVGGNGHGAGPEPNAKATYVDADATIKADALERGDGGRVVVWSDDYTNFAGRISARGGATGGDGGAVETSSRNILVTTGRVDAAAPAGKPGQWLLDPYDITITTGTSNGAFAGGVFTPSGNGATADAATISAALSSGTSVTIDTSGGAYPGAGAGGQNGDITFGVNGSITMSGATPATLTMIANSGMIVDASHPTISTTAGNSLNVVITLGNVATNGTLPGIGLGKGSLTLTTSGGHVFQDGALTQAPGGGAVTINLNGDGAAANGHGIDLTQAGNTITGTLSLLNAGGSGVTVVNSGALNLGTSTFIGGAGNPVSITAGGSITQSGTLTNTSGSSFTVATSVAGSDILLNTQANDLGSTGITLGGTLANIRDVGLRNVNAGATAPSLAGVTGLRNLTLQFDNAAIALGGFSASGAATVTAGGAITQGAAATVTGTSSFSAGGHAITLTQANHFSGGVSLSNSGAHNVQLTNAGATVLGTSSVGANLTVVSGGTISQTGALTVPGTTTLSSTAANSDVLLNTQANNFTGAVSIAGTAANIRDFALRNVNAAASVPALGGLTSLRNLTLRFDNAGMTLGAFSAGGTVNLTAGGTISIPGAVTLAGSMTLDTTAAASTGNAITLAAVTGAGQSLSLNAGSAGDITLTTLGGGASPLGALTITDARNVSGSGLIAVNSLTQSAGTGTTNFAGAGAGVSAAGAVTLTTGAVFGTYNVGGFTVTSGQTVATGTIAGVGGTAAAGLATAPGSTGTQTFNGCTIGSSCAAPAPVISGPVISGPVAVTVTTTTNQIVAAVSRQSAPSGDSGNSNVSGFEVTIPTQNVDWSNPSGDLSVTLAPELRILDPFFHGGQASR